MVHGLNRVCSACSKLAYLVEAEASDKIAVLVVNVEHSHLIKRIGNGDRYFILEVVGTIILSLHCAAFADRIEEIGYSADDGEIVLAGVAVGVGYHEDVLALYLINASYEGFAVNSYADILAKLNCLCKDVLVCRVAVEILIGACYCGSFLPVVVILDTDLSVLLDYLVESLRSEVSYEFFGIAGLVVDVVSSVCCIGCICGIHRNTGVPSGVIPLSVLYLRQLASLCELKSALVGCKREDIFVDVMNLKVLLCECVGKNVLLSGGELSLPLITGCVNYLHNVGSGIDRMNGGTVGDCLAVYGYGLNGSETVRITVGPGDHNVAVGFTARNVRSRYLLAGTVDNDRVLTGRVACGVNTVEHVLTNLVKLSAGNIAYKGSRAGHLNVAGFVTLEGDVLCVGVSSAACGIVICPKLCIGSLSVNSNRVGIRLVSGKVSCIEGVGSFSSECRARSVSGVTGCAGLLHVDRAESDSISCSELNGACVSSASGSSAGRTCIKSSGRLRVIQGNRHSRGLIARLVYTIEGIGSFGCKLSTAGIRGVVTGSGHLHVDGVNAGK